MLSEKNTRCWLVGGALVALSLPSVSSALRPLPFQLRVCRGQSLSYPFLFLYESDGQRPGKAGRRHLRVHLLGKQTDAGASKAVVVIEQGSDINFCFLGCIQWQVVNWQSLEVVDAEAVSDFFAPMIKGVAINLRGAWGPVDGIDKSVTGIVLAKHIWMLLDDMDETIASPEQRCGEHIPDADGPSSFNVFTEQSQDKINCQLQTGLNGCQHRGKASNDFVAVATCPATQRLPGLVHWCLGTNDTVKQRVDSTQLPSSAKDLRQRTDRIGFSWFLTSAFPSMVAGQLVACSFRQGLELFVEVVETQCPKCSDMRFCLLVLFDN